MKKYFKVTHVAYVPVDESDLKLAYNGGTFEEAIDAQRTWIEQDPATIEDLMSLSEHDVITMELVDELPEE